MPNRFPPPPPPPSNEPTVIALFLFLACLVVLMLLLVSSACQTWMMWKMAKAVVEREVRFLKEKRKGREDEEEKGEEGYAEGDASVEEGGRGGKRRRGTWMGGWFGARRRE